MPTPTVDSPSLHTKQLLLRPLDNSDAPALEAVLNDPAVRAAFGWQLDTSTSGAAWVTGNRELQARNRDSTFHFAWAIDLARTGALVGAVLLTRINGFEGGELEIMLDPQHRGQGYGPEAVDAVVRCTFETLVPTYAFVDGVFHPSYRVGKVTAGVLPDNGASIASFRKTLLIDDGVVTGRGRGGEQVPVHRFSLMHVQYQELWLG